MDKHTCSSDFYFGKSLKRLNSLKLQAGLASFLLFIHSVTRSDSIPEEDVSVVMYASHVLSTWSHVSVQSERKK